MGDTSSTQDIRLRFGELMCLYSREAEVTFQPRVIGRKKER